MEKKWFSSSQICDFSLEKAKLPEMTIFYVNQGYLSYKDNKNIYYIDSFILDQVTSLLKQPDNLDQYKPQENKAKIIREKYDTVTGQLLGLENCLAYLTVCGDFQEQFSDYSYSKENSKILYRIYKMKQFQHNHFQQAQNSVRVWSIF